MTENKNVPLFSPLTLRGVTFANRLWVSPMCQYSAPLDGIAREWHRVHIGSFATGGAGLIMMEATGVLPEGRISINCLGLWNDEQRDAYKPIVEFAHAMGTKIGIQLAHAGRKGSTMPPGSDHPIASIAEGGWSAPAPSEIAYGKLSVPHAMSIDEVKKAVVAFGAAAERAVDAGFDLVEIHAAHGYLIHQFLSPLSNARSDEYGGSFENRTRFLVQIVGAIRAAIPESMPLFVRISATDWVEGGWDLPQSIELARVLKNIGVDLIDVSSGALSDKQQIPIGPGYQVPFAEAIKKEAEIPTNAVGMIDEAEFANELVASGKVDAVMAARAFLRNPRWALDVAHELGADIKWPQQIAMGKRK
jgi:2,4-dienoyl-CoA reductase-like NADH-dependent reductase (Old Yellow Enzyme family)